MYRGIKIFLLYGMLIPVMLFSVSLSEKYPVYSYVFSEFDVDEAYIDNEDFNFFVQKNEKNMENLYVHAMKRGAALSSMVKGYLLDQGISDLFIYLSMVESGFSTDIVSSKKAVGLWQFMSETAHYYNLNVCNSFDERCDPVSSTGAAIRYLDKLHRQFGKWYLAAIAYNCGEGRLKKAISQAGSDALGVLTDERDRYLPQETRNYIRKILLVSMIGEGKYLDFPETFSSGKNAMVQVEVSGGCNLKALAETLKMESAELSRMNRQFKSGTVPQRKARYSIMIPEEKMIRFYLTYKLNEENKPPIKPYFVSHLVKMGDTLERIAQVYHSSVEEIKRANRLEDEFLELDSLLLVPVSKENFEQLLRAK